jgi:threonine/homoserine/homoserine lactone efflux protein
MMDVLTLFALAGAAAVNAAAPGPGILVIASRAATEGLQSGLRVALGIGLAVAILLAAAWAMILGALTLSASAVEVMRLVGLAVLVTLALAMLASNPGQSTGTPGIGRLRLGDIALGLTLGLTSPYLLVFVFVLLPQFVDLQRLDARSIAAASAAFLIGTMLPLLVACILASRILQTGQRFARRIMRGCGVALLGFAGLALVSAP